MSDYLIWWLVLILNVTNPWVELTLENWIAKKGCPKAYKHMVKDHNIPLCSVADIHDGSL